MNKIESEESSIAFESSPKALRASAPSLFSTMFPERLYPWNNIEGALLKGGTTNILAVAQTIFLGFAAVVQTLILAIGDTPQEAWILFGSFGIVFGFRLLTGNDGGLARNVCGGFIGCFGYPAIIYQ